MLDFSQYLFQFKYLNWFKMFLILFSQYYVGVIVGNLMCVENSICNLRLELADLDHINSG